jgi:23S rRNA pseudouridine1911/1915/1917 synthase
MPKPKKAKSAKVSVPPAEPLEADDALPALLDSDEDLATEDAELPPPSEDAPTGELKHLQPTIEHLTFDIKHDLQKRVDLYLRDRLTDASRAMLQKLVKSGGVLVNGRPAKSSTLLRSGDTVNVTLPKMVPPESLPENIPLDIIHEDDQFIAVNKQAGLIVHPARGHWSGTLINALLYHAEQTHSTLSVGSDPWRPGIIHRLDRDTTGLILIAKTDEAHWRLAGQFERRTIKKAYMALVHGELELDSDLIDAPLGINPQHRERYAVRTDSAGGKPAQTVYIVKERFKGYTLLELQPKTGRTHQLRVHCAHIGHPIVGDVTYGGKAITIRDLSGRVPSHTTPTEADAPLIERQALHAFRLQFVHPTKFTRMHLEAPIPPDIRHICDLLTKHRKQ